MKCPYCKEQESRVVDSRSSGEGEVIRRRRECLQCKRRYTTYERYEDVPRLVIKKDQRREPFSRQKVLQG
ncbi:MAG: transcriptional regulator NrdR, partial [Planctomycetota bacterium]